MNMDRNVLVTRSTNLYSTTSRRSIDTRVRVIFCLRKRRDVSVFIRRCRTIIKIICFLTNGFVNTSTKLRTRLLGGERQDVYKRTICIRSANLLGRIIEMIYLISISDRTV